MQPGLSIGFANGNYKEVSLASFVLRRPLNPRGDTTIIAMIQQITRPVTFQLRQVLNMILVFIMLFSKDDELDFIPSLIVNFGSDKLTQTHTNKIFDRLVKAQTIKR